MSAVLSLLGELDYLLRAHLILAGLYSIRLMVIFSLFPPAAEAVFQGRLRAAFVVLVALYMGWGVPVSVLDRLNGATLVFLALRESVIGLVIGFAASSVFWVAESAGIYVDDLTGYNNAQVVNPMHHESSTPTGTLMSQVAVMAFWALGGMNYLLGALFESYHWWPLDSVAPVMPHVLESFVLQSTDSLMQGVTKLALPMIFILVLVDVAVGFTAKSGAKMDLMSLGQPLKGAITVLMLALFVGTFVDQVRAQLSLAGLAGGIRAIAVQAHAR